MADAVGETLEQQSTLVVEAGTGVGKTFAYLVPAMLFPGKVMIATATRHLQDQLFLNDLPRVKQILQVSRDVALLKGRSNYLCRYRLEGAKTLEFIRSSELREQLRTIDAWAMRTKSGDLAECEGVPEDSPILGMVTSTTDNCLGSDCPNFQGCFVFEARRRAQEADFVVINHHLCSRRAWRAMRKQSLEPFVHYQLSQAILTFKQGAGRLIRGEQDRGVLMLCDPRICSKGYGRQFLDSLPPMRRTQSLKEVRVFFGKSTEHDATWVREIHVENHHKAHGSSRCEG